MKKDSPASTISDRIFQQPTRCDTSSRTSRSANSVNSNQTPGEQHQEDQDGESNNGRRGQRPPLNWREHEPANSRVFNSRNSLNGFCLRSSKRSLTRCTSARLLGEPVGRRSYGSLAENGGAGKMTSPPPAPAGAGCSPPVAVSDIIGSFGWFQFVVLLFSGLREGLVGYDALIMSVILQPETRFLCADNLPFERLQADYQLPAAGASNEHRHHNHHHHHHHGPPANLTSLFDEQRLRPNESRQCFLHDSEGNQLFDARQRPVACQNWLFPDDQLAIEQGPSLVAEWALVCHRHWLVAFVESAFFFGLVTGNLIWGYTADKLGRRPAYLAAHCVALLFGSLAVVAPTIWLFALCRLLSAFGAIGYNIIYSIQVEIIGVKHRSFSTILNHLGWGLGVIAVPLVDHLFDDYRPILAVAPLCSLLMFPWAFWLPESSRWLMAKGRFAESRVELLRAAAFNGKPHSPAIDKKIAQLEQNQAKVRSRAGQHYPAQSAYALIFNSRTLARDTLILSYLAFTGHLFYYLLTINFAYTKNLSTEANFIISGAGEWVSVVVGAVLLKFCSRRACMSLFLLLMTGSFLFQALAESQLAPSLDTPAIVTTNNAVGTLSALLLIFIVLIVNQEVYPTLVRQTGTSLTNTLGESGSTLAPLLIQFSRLVGPWRANLLCATASALGMLAAHFVTKTDDIELPDTVD